jgi:HlyD family secretion protein
MKQLLLALIPLVLVSCSVDNEKADAYGNFEAIETTISSKASGEIILLKATQGQLIKQGDTVLIIDTTDLVLQKKQLIAQKDAVLSGKYQVEAQIEMLEKTIAGAETEVKRVRSLFLDGAATEKQKDEAENKIEVLTKQHLVHAANIKGIDQQARVFNTQLDLVDKKIADCIINSPVKGTVLQQYIELGELAIQGKPLFKVANLDEIILRVYISGEQLSTLRIGSTVQVRIDAPGDQMKNYEGRLIWISGEAEFTPKVVQTKEERLKQVYAAKILVKNDGAIKIGMPGELWLNE